MHFKGNSPFFKLWNVLSILMLQSAVCFPVNIISNDDYVFSEIVEIIPVYHCKVLP